MRGNMRWRPLLDQRVAEVVVVVVVVSVIVEMEVRVKEEIKRKDW